MWKKLLFANLLLAAVLFVTADRLFGILPARGERIIVPDFQGAQEETLAADPRFSVSAEYRYDDSPAGTILSQEPAPGAARKIGEGQARCQLRVVVSMGPECVLIPDLTGQNAAVAAAELRRMGLLVQTQADPALSLFPAGKVTATNPPAGSRLQVGQTVVLSVSSGKIGVALEE